MLQKQAEDCLYASGRKIKRNLWKSYYRLRSIVGKLDLFGKVIGRLFYKKHKLSRYEEKIEITK
jgi:hypothetical protein